MSGEMSPKELISDVPLPNWELIDEVSIALLESGLARFSTLQAVLPTMLSFDATSEEATQRSRKLLRISQLQIEYLLKSQNQLVQQIQKMKNELISKRKEVKRLKAAVFNADAPLFKNQCTSEFRRRLYCRLFDDQMDEILPATQSIVFPEFTIRCPASDKARFVALSLNSDDSVPLQDRHEIHVDKKGKREYLSVCLAPLWGTTPKWLLLIEFIEYYRLQGVEHFYVYRQSTDNYTETILNSYESEGVVEVVNIGETTNCMKRHRCRHEMQLQDCVFRTRGRSDWVATVDLDERISVNGGNTIKEYIKQVEGMGVHQVLRFSPGATVLFVPPEDAVVRHYRLTKGWTFFLKEAETFGSFEETYLVSTIRQYQSPARFPDGGGVSFCKIIKIKG
ncbi:hypothetical protein TELCIR_03936 [Teladorsagia circumcincta]|uniref:Glycosyltransferase family 92 protein n=1 Tax=Teladorsagia circumcincta TaxID=45464 RepID=A0A2G9UUZ5_TELCI|nr:hypothetical protein TELCIR_03936 [Teladorsagia circumcincta]